MKKVLLILLSLALVLSMTGVVAGDYSQMVEQFKDVDAGGSKDVTVSFSVHNSYVVKFPAEFTFSSTDYKAGGTINAEITTIGEGEFLNVTITGFNSDESDWYLTSDNANDHKNYKYYVAVNTDTEGHLTGNEPSSPVKSGETIISIAADSAEKQMTKIIHMLLVDRPTSAAYYSDKITFTVTIGE